MLATLASDRVLDAAYAWLCAQRRHWPANADVWGLRFRWLAEKAAIRQTLLAGHYRFAPLTRITKSDGQCVYVWSARDALVLKALAIVLGGVLPVSRRCVHVKGHGGAKAAVRAVTGALPDYAFVLRTDVKAYYDSIDQYRLLDLLAAHIKDRDVLNLLWQAMRRTVTWGGLFRDCRRGIARGCPLSPLLGALFLSALDAEMQRLGLFYVRFMDDVVVLAPTRWTLRRAVKRLNAVLAGLGLEKHPEKTFIGRVEKGFDFLGYHFTPQRLSIAEDTRRRFREQLARLYEQGCTDREPVHLGKYIRRWVVWARSGLAHNPDLTDVIPVPGVCNAGSLLKAAASAGSRHGWRAVTSVEQPIRTDAPCPPEQARTARFNCAG